MKLASELFAKSLSRKCEGAEVCHWCGGPCDRRWTHDDVVSVPFSRTRSSARYPGNAFVCVGCWYYRRKSVTVRFLDQTYKDRQSLSCHSWLLTVDSIHGLSPADHNSLYAFLLKPKLPFVLSLLSDAGNVVESLLHLACLNNQDKLQGDSELAYTLDNKRYTYTPYELEEALKHGTDGKSGGVKLLVDRLGPYSEVAAVDPEAKLERGRPKKEDRERLPGRRIK